MGIHDGHRARMKRRFAEHGLDNFDDHNVLELLLFYALPRQDTNPIAHELMDRFGSLAEVFEAPLDELKKVKGLGDGAALFLSLVPQVSRRYMVSKASEEIILNTSAKAGEYLLPRFAYERDEVVYMVCLDAKCMVLSCRELSRGVVNTAEVRIRKIVEIALAQNATAVLLAHNHTSGIAIPSLEDKRTTKVIKSALTMVGIDLADHIVVAGGDYVSMADSGDME